VQPVEPDAWTFEKIDPAIEKANQLGLKVLAILSYTPKWAATCEPDEKKYRVFAHREDCDQAYQNYLKTMVEHYKDKIAAWEICNEIDHFGFLKLAPGCWVENHHPTESDMNKRRLQYLHMVELAFEVLKPLQVTITTSGFAMGGSYDEGAVAWMVKERPDLFKQFDIFNVHAYGWPLHVSLTNRIEEIKRIQADNGLNLPLWFTEHGINVRPETIKTIDDAKAFMIKSYAIAFGRGVEKLFWYRHAAGNGAHTTILDKKNQPTLMFDGYKLMTQQWAKPVSFTLFAENGLEGTVATLDSGKKVAIVWAQDEKVAASVLAPQADHVFDMNGEDVALTEGQFITSYPVFVHLK